MKIKKIATLSLICMVLGTASLAESCGKKKIHEPDTSFWKYDEVKHWRACKACDEERFDEGEHELSFKDGAQFCTICDYSFSYNDEENYALWKKGLEQTLNYDGVYTFHSTSIEEAENSKQEVIETLAENGLFYQDTKTTFMDTGIISREYSTGVFLHDDQYVIVYEDNVYDEDTDKVYNRSSYYQSDETHYRTYQSSNPSKLIMENDTSLFAQHFSTYQELEDYLPTALGLYNQYTYRGALKSISFSLTRNGENAVSLGLKMQIEENEYNANNEITASIQVTTDSSITMENQRLSRIQSQVTVSIDNVETKEQMEYTSSYEGTYIYNTTPSYIESLQVKDNATIEPREGYIRLYYQNYLYDHVFSAPLGSSSDFIYDQIYEDLFKNEYTKEDRLFDLYLDIEGQVPYQSQKVTTQGSDLYIVFHCPPEQSLLLITNECLYAYPDDYPFFLTRYRRNEYTLLHALLLEANVPYSMNNFGVSGDEFYFDGKKTEEDTIILEKGQLHLANYRSYKDYDA